MDEFVYHVRVCSIFRTVQILSDRRFEKGVYDIMRISRVRQKLFATAAGALLTLPVCQPFALAESDNWDAVYQPESYTLIFNGELKYTDFLMLRIVPYQDRNTVLKESAAWESEKDIVKTIEPQADNTISASVILPESYIGERYIYHANTDEERKSGFLICADMEQLNEKLHIINEADAAGIKKLLTEDLEQSGIDNGDTDKDIDYTAKLLVSFRPAGGYTAEGFLKCYMQSEGIAYVKQNVYTLEQMLEAYEVYMDEDYSEIYSEMSEAARASLEQQFRTELTGTGFGELFSENKFLAEYWNADSTESFKTIVLNYFIEKNISTDNYNKISNEYKKNTIFDELYKNRKNHTTTDEIVSEFERLTKSALNSSVSSGTGGGSSSGGGPSSGGTSSGNGHGMMSGASGTAAGGTVKKTAFSDMDSHWSREAVETMTALGIIDGFDNGTFQPDRSVTRAEFSKMIAVMLELQQVSENEFSDVAADSWYAPYVSMAAEAGIILGSNGEFMPEADITRQDAAVMLHRVLKYKDALNNAQPEMSYTDADQVSDYAEEAVASLTGCGVLNGAGGLFNPKSSMTRGEAATMLYRILDLI